MATRYEKLAIHYLALVQFNVIRVLVQRLERTLPGAYAAPVVRDVSVP